MVKEYRVVPAGSQELTIPPDGQLPSPRFDVAGFMQTVLAYYQRTKGVGHTKCLFPRMGYIDGGAVRPLVVTHNDSFGRVLSPSNSIGLMSFTPKNVMTLRQPLLWDNSAIITVFEFSLKLLENYRALLSQAGSRIDHLEGSLEEERIRSSRLHDKLETLERKNKKLTALVLKLHRVRMEAVGELASLDDEVLPEHSVFGLANETDELIKEILGVDYAEAWSMAVAASEREATTKALIEPECQEEDGDDQQGS